RRRPWTAVAGGGADADRRTSPGRCRACRARPAVGRAVPSGACRGLSCHALRLAVSSLLLDVGPPEASVEIRNLAMARAWALFTVPTEMLSSPATEFSGRSKK